MRHGRGFLLLALLPAAGAAWGGEPLLRNGDFSEPSPGGVPLHWKTYGTDQKLAMDREQVPEGCAQSLRVDIRSAHPGSYGQVAQSLRGLKRRATYVLTGSVRSTAPRLAFLSVKLVKGRKELKRLASGRSGTGWQALRRTFYTGEADEAIVLCRYEQKQASVGQTVWFAGLRLTEAGPPWLKVADATPTFHSLSLTAACGGSVPPTATCRVRYRRRGQQAWRRGMDLFADREDSQFRGSLFGLRPDTAYEVECRLAEPGAPAEAPAAGRCTATAGARTWSERVPVGEVRTLPVGPTREPLVIREKGTADGWIVYRPAEGKTATLDAGVAAEQAVRFEQAAYVVFEGVTVRGGSQDGIRVIDSHHVRIRRCDIAGWGDPGERREGLSKGLYVDKRGRQINYHAGVEVSRNSSQVVVEDNYIHAPRGTANSWAHGHPMGPQGILLTRTGGNHVVRHNDVIGSEAHWWNDAIESIANSEVTGGPYRDTDIYGNVLAFANDDGIELDGGQINVRFWGNWIDRALCGVSCAPNRKGPSYVFRNVIVLGEERQAAGSAFKMGGGARWSTGMNVILHNTICGPGGGLRSVGYGREKNRGGYLAFSRNNLFACGAGAVTNTWGDPRNDFDYDLTHRGGIRLAAAGQQRHAVTGRPRFVGAAAGDYRLAAGSPGIDRGCRLPGVNDDFAGAAPDIGAFELGRAKRADFPVRPSGISALPQRVSLSQVGAAPASAEVALTVPPAAGKRWRALPNSPWLACLPPDGPAGEKPQRVRVTVAKQHLPTRLHRGAVTFRTDRGLNRTIMVELRVYPARPVAVAVEAECGKIAGGFVEVRDASASGGAYVHTPEGAEPGSVVLGFDVPEAGEYYLAARCMAPEPNSGVHDSFRFSMDGEPKRIWDLKGLPGNDWGWCLLAARDAESPERYRLARGVHRLTVTSREYLARLDRVVLTNCPYPEAPLPPAKRGPRRRTDGPAPARQGDTP